MIVVSAAMMKAVQTALRYANAPLVRLTGLFATDSKQFWRWRQPCFSASFAMVSQMLSQHLTCRLACKSPRFARVIIFSTCFRTALAFGCTANVEPDSDFLACQSLTLATCQNPVILESEQKQPYKCCSMSHSIFNPQWLLALALRICLAAC